MTMKEMKARREELWEQLHALKAEYEPKEKAIRNEIRDIQEELFRREMTPVMLKLQNKVEEGEASDAEKQKLALLEAKLS